MLLLLLSSSLFDDFFVLTDFFFVVCDDIIGSCFVLVFVDQMRSIYCFPVTVYVIYIL